MAFPAHLPPQSSGVQVSLLSSHGGGEPRAEASVTCSIDSDVKDEDALAPQQQDFSAAARCIAAALHLPADGLPSSTSQRPEGTGQQQYQHGNYQAYYGYRLGADSTDPRLQV